VDTAEGQNIARRRVLTGGAVAATAWVTPTVIRLDRVAAAVPSRPYQTWYEENFQAGIGNPDAVWSTTQTEAAPADPNRVFLGRFGNQTISLTLQNLPAHDFLCIEFDLYIIESWDGGHPKWGNDRFGVRLDGAQVMLDSFGHWRFGTRADGANFDQTYGPNALNQAGTGTSERNTLGYDKWGNQVHPISLCNLEHTASSATVEFFGLGLQSLNDESWGMDNLTIRYA